MIPIEITSKVAKFLNELISTKQLDLINIKLQETCGCIDFFPSSDEISMFKSLLDKVTLNTVSDNRAEYGDYQTNSKLANAVIEKLLSKKITSEFLIEPTCGKGNFILAAIQKIQTLKEIWGIEIHEPYIWQCKLSILDFYLNHPNHNKPKIHIIKQDVFYFNFNAIKKLISKQNLLLIGNPPWVTNSMLGGIGANNHPIKSNFKKQKGLDAITGKGNFDIAEHIMYTLLKTFDSFSGHTAFLIKNSVIKNIIYEQETNQFRIANIEEQNIDCTKEFSVTVEASLFTCELNSIPEKKCNVYDFYNQNFKYSFGWQDEIFVSNIELSQNTTNLTGECPFVWRQGVKHDCSKVMEITRTETGFTNKLEEHFLLEEDLVFDILKSSDLKSLIACKAKKCTIITQKRIGQDTVYLSSYPKTFNYLQAHKSMFEERKSSIYRGKPAFSIFGIGDYSFAPYKVAISGLYKTFHFTIITPNKDNKPVMLDDTCYFIGFENVEEAAFITTLLNSSCVKQFLKSISFPDSKRMITKDILMKIDLRKALKCSNIEQIEEQTKKLLQSLGISNDSCSYNNIQQKLTSTQGLQLTLF